MVQSLELCWTSVLVRNVFLEVEESAKVLIPRISKETFLGQIHTQESNWTGQLNSATAKVKIEASL